MEAEGKVCTDGSCGRKLLRTILLSAVIVPGLALYGIYMDQRKLEKRKPFVEEVRKKAAGYDDHFDPGEQRNFLESVGYDGPINSDEQVGIDYKVDLFGFTVPDITLGGRRLDGITEENLRDYLEGS